VICRSRTNRLNITDVQQQRNSTERTERRMIRKPVIICAQHLHIVTVTQNYWQGRLSPLRPWSKPPFPFPSPFPSPSFTPSSHPFPLPSPPLFPLRSRLPKIQLGGLGERCKLPQRGLGQSPSRNRIWCILALKSDTL